MGFSFRSYRFVNLVFWLLLLFHPTHAHFTSSDIVLCHDDERSALLQFKESLTINETASSYPSAYAKVESWKVQEGNDDCCTWDGIKCNEDTGHLVRLDLTSSYLYGSINSNSSLFQLVHLEWLSLADNDFNYSKIPSAIMNLSRLTHLDLSYSVFSGQIPSGILGLSKLVLLNVSYNGGLELKTGGLRNLAEGLSNLEMLDLSRVNISSSIPHTLANLSSLTYLSLAECKLQDEFPTKVFQLSKLYFLNVGHNRNLTLHLPEFEKHSPLEELRLSATRLSSGIPNSIGNLKSLSHLEASECELQGMVPSSLGNLTHLSYLDLSYNDFSSQNISSSSWITNLTKLTYLDLSSINLVGGIPIWFSDLIQLRCLALGQNELTGAIPDWLLNLNQLEVLYLPENQFTGQIPFEIRNLTQLTTLDLGSNRLEGPIPSSVFELKNLEQLDLSSNNLSGILNL